jgi:hypothetical protein
MNEIILAILWSDGNETLHYFDTCEETWLYERKVKKENANRRARADRKYIILSYYAGCTVNGNTYGGILSGFYATSAEKLENLKRMARCHRGFRD